MTSADLSNAIVRTASRFIGLREVKANAEWDNPATPGSETALSGELRAMMRPAPWEPGWAYCAAFAEGVVTTALRSLGATPDEVARFASVMSPHCVTAANRFRQRGLLSQLPAPGAIWLAQHAGTSNGHAGIVQTVSARMISTIEANTSLDSANPAKDREGDWITTKLFSRDGRGRLRTLGFITPEAVTMLLNAERVANVSGAQGNQKPL